MNQPLGVGNFFTLRESPIPDLDNASVGKRNRPF